MVFISYLRIITLGVNVDSVTVFIVYCLLFYCKLHKHEEQQKKINYMQYLSQITRPPNT